VTSAIEGFGPSRVDAASEREPGMVNAVLVEQGRLKMFTETTPPRAAQAGLIRLGIKWSMSGLESHVTPVLGRYLAETTHVVQVMF
jgi:hypothetical protein